MNPETCRHLRTKTLYVPAQMADSECPPDESAASRHCWCNQTMTPVGRDDRRVGPELCSDPQRSCYEPR